MDFSQLKRPPRNSKPLDPIAIFERRPSRPDTPNDLWRGQTEALTEWHKNRAKSDVLIALNTGAGKTIVGLLIAQSLVNEGIENVTYLCSTNDLVLQTQREAPKLGIDCTLRIYSNFDNNLFETGKSFCITNYASLFNGLSVLQRSYFPGAVIFDDAHVAERMIRDSFTLKITREKHSVLFQEIKFLFENHFRELGKYGSFEEIINNPSQFLIMATPTAVREHCERLYNLLIAYGAREDSNLKYAFKYLKDNLGHCSVIFAHESIEIAPPFLPIFSLPIFSRNIRRIYLSATLNYKSDIARAFGQIPEVCIEPKNDAGNGERLVLFADELPSKKINDTLIQSLSLTHKVLIAVPSYPQAQKWIKVGTPPSQENFSAKLEEFRDALSGTFILVSRVDGIDLPHDTCRVMVLDGLPTGASLLEQYQWNILDMSNFRAAKVSNQIIQLFGRINRGRNDYGVFIINGKTLSNWLRTDRKLALLPELLRKQIKLGLCLHDQQKSLDDSKFVDVINQVLSREQGWIDFYGDSITNMEVDDEAFQRTQKIEESITKAAVAEVRFMSEIWERNYTIARQTLEEVIEDTARADTKLAGWHNFWIGMCLEFEQDYESAQDEYSRAYKRLGNQIIIPKLINNNQRITSEIELSTDFERQIYNLVGKSSQQSYQKASDRLRQSVAALDNLAASAFQHEEALRSLGEYLGFNSTRPDNDFGTGPDVLWINEITQECLPFELKTGKKSDPIYYKKDIQEGHDHISWIQTNYENYHFLGLIYVGPQGKRHQAGNPSSDMFLCDLSTINLAKNQLIAGIEDLRKLTPAQKICKVKEFCTQSKWTLEGLASKFKGKSMQNLELFV